MAEAAYQQGRGQPGVDSLVPTARRILASSGLVSLAADAAAVTPAWNFDRTIATETIRTLAGQIDIPVQNAGVTVVDGKVQTTPGQGGRALDVGDMLATLESHPWDVALARPQNVQLRFTMPVVEQAPPISDVSAIVNELTPLLANPITVQLYDPIRDERGAWTVQPADIGRWIGVGEAQDESTGQKKLTWSVDESVRCAILLQPKTPHLAMSAWSTSTRPRPRLPRRSASSKARSSRPSSTASGSTW